MRHATWTSNAATLESARGNRPIARTRRTMRLALSLFILLDQAFATRTFADAEPAPRIGVVYENGSRYLTSNGVAKYLIVEGDILVPLDAAAATYNDDLWDNGIVRFEFDDNVPEPKRALMRNAFLTMEQVATVHFVEGIGILDSGIKIESTSSDDCPGCACVNAATVGETFFGSVSICSWNSAAVLLHELGHVLNLYHEQSRPDRDSFVQIIWENIKDGEDHNFDMHDDGYGPYDFASLMHYGQCFFSECNDCPIDPTCPDGGRTIVVLPPFDAEWQNDIGTVNDLSHLDRLTLSFLYPQSDWRFVDQAACITCAISSCVGNAFFCRFIDFSPLTAVCPACTFPDGYESTPTGGTIWVQPGFYSAVGTYLKAARIEAPLGDVALGA